MPGTVFPLVLAGPLLRRVERRLVSVWLALASPRHVFLKVWQAPQAAATSQAPLGEEGVSSSRRIGERLRLALVTKTLPEPVAPLLPAVTRVGIELSGAQIGADGEILAHERLPAMGSDYPADQSHFPTGRRQALVRSQGGLSTTGGHSHLLSLGEYCASYLLSWSNSLWPDTLPPLASTLDGRPSPLDDLDLLTPSDAVAVEDQRKHYATELHQASETQHIFDIAIDASPSGQQVLNDLNQAAVTDVLRGELSDDLGPNASIDVETTTTSGGPVRIRTGQDRAPRRPGPEPRQPGTGSGPVGALVAGDQEQGHPGPRGLALNAKGTTSSCWRDISLLSRFLYVIYELWNAATTLYNGDEPMRS